jgi:hypothetical protein
VCVNELGGFRNTIEFVLVGLDIDAKADWVRSQMEAALAQHPPASVTWSLARTDREDATTEEAASSRLRCSVRDSDPDVVGKRFTAAAVELGLASYPGFTLTAPPAPASPYGVYKAAYVDRSVVTHTVVHPDGSSERVADPPSHHQAPRRAGAEPTGTPAAVASGGSGAACGADDEAVRVAAEAPQDQVTRRLPLGTFVHARSGDKGGDANIGLWVDRSRHADARTAWLTKLVTPDRIRELLPETADLPVEVYPLPNLGAVNVVIRGLLGEGVAASTRFDPQAKALGEWLRSRHVSITEDLL